MSAKTYKILFLIESLVLVLAVVGGLINMYWDNRTTNPLIVYDGVIVEYETSEDGFIVVIYNPESNKAIPFHISESELEEVCSERCMMVLEAQLTGINVTYGMHSYRYGDAEKSGYLYPLRTILIPPYEMDRIEAEKLLPEQAE